MRAAPFSLLVTLRGLRTRSLVLAITCAIACSVPEAFAQDARDVQLDEALAMLEELLRHLEEDASTLANVLKVYDRIESANRFSAAGRYRIHAGLLDHLRSMEDPVLAKVAAEHLARASKASLPSQVLLLKTLIGERFPAPRAERVQWMRALLDERNDRHAIWAARLLAEARWPESIRALIETLDAEEAAKRIEGVLYNLVAAELYRILGGRAGLAGAAATRKDWEDGGEKVPERPNRDPADATGGSGRTAAFFGDRVAPLAVFCIDTSGSMRETTTYDFLRATRGRTAAPVEEKDLQRAAKIDIVKRELHGSLESLSESWKFNIFRYGTNVAVWKGNGRLRLNAARSSAVSAAQKWVAGLQPDGQTNIHDTLVAAFSVPDVETVYLLSDGAPTVGGGPQRIRERVLELNYLLGVRIITYGFAAEAVGDYDEELMRDLAAANWGWYRRLN